MAAVIESPPGELEESINRLGYLTKDIRLIDAQSKALKSERTDLQEKIMDLMQEAGGIKTAGTDVAKVSVSETEVVQVDKDHWEEVWRWIIANDHTELLKRSLNSAPYRELVLLEIEVPYTSTFKKVKLNCSVR